MRGEVGVAEQRLREAFQEARRLAPCVLFVDELQAVFTGREGRGPGASLTGGLVSRVCPLSAVLAVL